MPTSGRLVDADDRASIETTLAGLKTPVRVISSARGPTFTRYGLRPEPGVRVARILRLGADLALALGVETVRLEPDADAIGLEVPRVERETVALGPLMAEATWPRSALAFALGRDVSGRPHVADLARMPHLLIAGATGSGKSVALNVLLTSMLGRASPGRLRLVLIDAKRVELAPYAGLPHLWRPVATEVEDAEAALAALVTLMEARYARLAQHRVRSIAELERPWPRYVCVVDELADLVMASKRTRDLIIRLAQKARAAGIHLVLATQRPSADVISGLLKANVPGRMAFATTSGTDSRVILDVSGAEDLLGRGDMLFGPPWQQEPIRLQGAFVTDAEIARTVTSWLPPPVATATEAPAERPATWVEAGFAVLVVLVVLLVVLGVSLIAVTLLGLLQVD